LGASRFSGITSLPASVHRHFLISCTGVLFS
jgi:hypothetical protein